MADMKILFCLVLVLLVHTNEASRILCIFPFNGYSHFTMFKILCKGLAERGHRIDMISHFPLKKPHANYTDLIDLGGHGKSVSNSFSLDFLKELQATLMYWMAGHYGGAICNLMGLESMQKFIKNPPNDPPYDLVITEYFASPCYLGFGELLKVPVVVAISFLEMPYVNDFMGNPQNYAYFPGFFTKEAKVDTFRDRLWNFLSNYQATRTFHYYTSDQTDMMRKYLGLPWIPDVRELERKVSLALVNSHHSLFGIRSMTPAVVEVGGLHVYNDQPELDPVHKKWIDSADHGLIYFSFGSIVELESFPRKTILSMYAAFERIAPVKVLMKSTNVTKLPPGIPGNVMTAPWIAQVAVLKHKNTRGFVTHGGLMGTQEAIHYGVPVIGIPSFIDQMRNVNIMAEKGIGIVLWLQDINEHTMYVALDEILHNPKYRQNAKEMAKLFNDRPMNPLDTAVYWVEYVLRNGADSLRSPAVDLPWWKLNLVDIFAFLITSLVLLIYILITLLRKVLSKFSKARHRTEKKMN